MSLYQKNLLFFRIKSQQDIIELQRIKLQRQQRVIAEMKLSKLLEDTDDSESRLKEQLKYMAKNGCQNSRSKARCLQIASDLKDQEDDETQNLLAKGLSAPKFLIEMQARALEREMRHQKAQERRVMLDREREILRIAAEEEKVYVSQFSNRLVFVKAVNFKKKIRISIIISLIEQN